MTNHQPSMPPDVKTIFETLQEDVIWVHAKWKVFRQLFGTSEKRIAILNDFAPDFFQIVHDGLIYDILLTMSRLTDPAETSKKENLTLDRLLLMLKRNEDEDFIGGIERDLESLKHECQPFRDIRNRRIAHSDLGTALDYHPNPLPGVSREMIETTLKSFRNLLNEIEKHFDGNETEYVDFDLRGDGDSIIHYFKEAKAYHQHRIHGRVDPIADGVSAED
jgi:hypothetical protein